jgi:hypothetical protein
MVKIIKSNIYLYTIIGLLVFFVVFSFFMTFNFKELFTNDKKLIYLYLDDCRYCEAFNVQWNEIVNQVNANRSTYDFTVEKYKLDEPNGIGARYAKDYNIGYAPAIIFVSSKVAEYNDSTRRNSSDILAWANKQNYFVNTTIVK